MQASNSIFTKAHADATSIRDTRAIKEMALDIGGDGRRAELWCSDIVGLPCDA